MRVLAGSEERGPILSVAVVLGALSFLTLALLTGLPTMELAPAVAVATVAAVWYRSILSWRNLLAATILIILFVPIRRYTMPGNLPFELEPYRLLVAFVASGWLLSLLADPRRVRLRASGLDWPLMLLAATMLASVIVNAGRVHALGVEDVVTKKLTFFASFFLVFYLIVSVVRERVDIDRLVRVLVAGGAIVATFALIEFRTGFNGFNTLSNVLPFLELNDVLSGEAVNRAGRLRVYGSAQHPIALGALLVMLLPFAAYLARRFEQRRWWLAGGVMLMGALATLSRTSVIMLAVILVVLLRLRPGETKRLWVLVLPAALLVHLALPGTIGTFRQSFFPSGGLIAEQQQLPGGRGSGRLADFGPSLEEWARQPVLGQGFGTRVVDEGRANALILDNQWLGTLLETGAAGVLAWLLLFTRAVRRLARAARNDPSPDGWLYSALAASIAAFGVAMFFFDAFSFIQVTVVLFVLLGFAAVLGTKGGLRPAVRR